MNIKKNSPLKQEEHHAVEKEEAEGDACSSLRKWVTISRISVNVKQMKLLFKINRSIEKFSKFLI